MAVSPRHIFVPRLSALGTFLYPGLSALGTFLYPGRLARRELFVTIFFLDYMVFRYLWAISSYCCQNMSIRDFLSQLRFLFNFMGVFSDNKTWFKDNFKILTFFSFNTFEMKTLCNCVKHLCDQCDSISTQKNNLLPHIKSYSQGFNPFGVVGKYIYHFIFLKFFDIKSKKYF